MNWRRRVALIDTPEPNVVRAAVADNCVADRSCKAGLQGSGEKDKFGQHDQCAKGRLDDCSERTYGVNRFGVLV